jgi:hypothetical protein
MKKIIRVTESELIKMIGKVINEQANVAPYYNFRTGQMAGKGAPAPAPAPAPGTAMDPNGDPTKFIQQKKLNIDCIGLKLPETNKTITGINGETFKFFNTGRFADVKGQKGNYTCGNQANIINLMYDSDPKAVKYFNMTPKPEAQQKQQQTKTVFVANEKFPLKFQQKGEAIKKIQTALGIKPTGNFWTLTEKAVLAKAPEYKRATGITEDIYNKIVGGQTTVNPNINQQLLQRGQDFQTKNAERIKQNSQLSQQQQADRNNLNIRQ